MASSSNASGQTDFSGWLFKWTNCFCGYQKRWFVLSQGCLSYYRSPEEMRHTCRGTINLQGATIYSDVHTNIVISNGETFHIRAANEIERRNWVNALESAKQFSAVTIEDDRSGSVAGLVVELRNKLETVRSCNELVSREGSAIQTSVAKVKSSTSNERGVQELVEQAEVFQASSSAMVEACTDYLCSAECHEEQLLDEEAKRRVQQDEDQSTELIRISLGQTVSESDSDNLSDEGAAVFYDCDDLSTAVSRPTTVPTIQVVYSAFPSDSDRNISSQRLVTTSQIGIIKNRRRRIPNRPNAPMNLWSVIKNAIGKDLTKIPVPVNFSEPLSLLQRLTEDFEYAHVLDKASLVQDPGEQLAYLAGFAISSYSTTVTRTGKPFNPLLGETFECDRTHDLGWRSVAEQVSHHPPVAAIYCEGKQWECWEEQSLATKFRGQCLQVIPLGAIHVRFKSGNHYTWRKVTTSIHNIVIGKLWIDQEGEMEIGCHTNGFKCKMSFLPQGYFGQVVYKVKGTVFDNHGRAQLDVAGAYDSKIEVTRTNTGKPPQSPSQTSKSPSPVNTFTVWEKVEAPSDSELYYNFTVFACQLNEMEGGIAPTDSRNRPDQRYMEEGDWDLANTTKLKLEEQQRNARVQRQASSSLTATSSSDPYQPTWFMKGTDPITKDEMFVYRGEYWPCKKKGDWSRCPQIY